MADGTRMQQRRATEAVWATSDYVLAAGELGVTTDTGIIKIGNGITPWTGLDPAFDSQYLPILGKAADSDLLDGISASGFWQNADATTAATASKLALRTGTGTLKAAAASASDDLVAKSQLDTTNTNVTTNTADIADLKAHTVADRTALLAISTGTLPYGYLVTQSDKGYIWMWDLVAWRYRGRPSADHPYIHIQVINKAWASAGLVWGYSLVTNKDSSFYSWTAGTSSAAGGSITVLEDGKYRIEAAARMDCGSAYYSSTNLTYPSIPSTYKLNEYQNLSGSQAPSGFEDLFVVDEGRLPVNQTVKQTIYTNNAGTNIRQADIMVMRLPSI